MGVYKQKKWLTKGFKGVRVQRGLTESRQSGVMDVN